jgi:hypothetical protein
MLCELTALELDIEVGAGRYITAKLGWKNLGITKDTVLFAGFFLGDAATGNIALFDQGRGICGSAIDTKAPDIGSEIITDIPTAALFMREGEEPTVWDVFAWLSLPFEVQGATYGDRIVGLNRSQVEDGIQIYAGKWFSGALSVFIPEKSVEILQLQAAKG